MRAGTALTDAWFGCLDWLLVNASLAADVNQSYLFLWDSPDPSPSHERFFKLNMAVHASDLFYLWEGKLLLHTDLMNYAKYLYLLHRI